MKPVWLSHYPAGVPAEVDVRGYASLVDLFEQSCRRFRDRPAFSSMGATLSYAETDRLSRDFAAYLQGLGLLAGDRVAIMLPNLLQYPVALFGVLRAGLVAVNVNPLYTARHYEAALVLRDIDAGEGGSRLKQTTPAPLRQAVTYTVEGRARQADLYLPATLETCAENCPRATLIAVPGAVPLASDDPRFTAFANSLARAGYAVLAPRMPGFRQLRVRPADAREIADAFAYAAGRPELAPGGRAGLFAFSYAVGPAVLTALEPGFWTQDLPDLWRLWRVMDLLLAEREAAP